MEREDDGEKQIETTSEDGGNPNIITTAKPPSGRGSKLSLTKSKESVKSSSPSVVRKLKLEHVDNELRSTSLGQLPSHLPSARLNENLRSTSERLLKNGEMKLGSLMKEKEKRKNLDGQENEGEKDTTQDEDEVMNEEDTETDKHSLENRKDSVNKEVDERKLEEGKKEEEKKEEEVKEEEEKKVDEGKKEEEEKEEEEVKEEEEKEVDEGKKEEEKEVEEENKEEDENKDDQEEDKKVQGEQEKEEECKDKNEVSKLISEKETKKEQSLEDTDRPRTTPTEHKDSSLQGSSKSSLKGSRIKLTSSKNTLSSSKNSLQQSSKNDVDRRTGQSQSNLTEGLEHVEEKQSKDEIKEGEKLDEETEQTPVAT